jgi:prolyl-tRNA synthetase
MKQSKMLVHTLRDTPKDADVISQQLMMRAGMLQKLAVGIYSYLPLAFKSIKKFEDIVRSELIKDGCQELLMPVVQPGELWQESGRWNYYGRELLRFKDRKSVDCCLGPTHEEVITDIVRRNVTSYKQLPMNIFQIQTKFRDEIRPRFGLMRSREFIMKDGYSFDTNEGAADESYWTMFRAYQRIFSSIGVKFRYVEADSGAIGGSFTHEFHVLAGSGEDSILSCDACSYTSNAEKTEVLPVCAINNIPPMNIRLAYFHTPGILAIENQAQAFCDEQHKGLPLHRTSKVYWLDADIVVSDSIETSVVRRVAVAVVLRGDHEINLVKVKSCINALELKPMDNAEDFVGAASGFLGPIPKKGTRHWQLQEDDPGSIVYLVDRTLDGVCNLTCGSNITDFHHFGFDPRRDLPGARFVDVRMAKEGDTCARCQNGRYQAFRGIEVGQVFKLGAKYSKAMNCVYLDEHGKENPMIMGCYGIGITRTIAAVIEQHFDADGIVWPWPIAPYHVHILNLDPSNVQLSETANKLEKDLESSGFEVVHDDREGLGPGVKFKDADLLGFPLRITVGLRDLRNGVVELRDRRTKDAVKIKPENAVIEVAKARDRILKELKLYSES